MTIPEQAVAHDWPYQRTLDAISAAIKWQPDRHIEISVEAFAKAFGPMPLMGVQRPEDVAEFVQAADALRASLPDHWHDDTVTEYDDARAAINKQQSKPEKCVACGREPALFYNCFRQRQDCPQRALLALPHTAQPQEGWRLVPVQPTDAMIASVFGIPVGRRVYQGGEVKPENQVVDLETSKAIYRAMLSAAPASPQRTTDVLRPIHLKLLKRGVDGRYIGLADDMSIRHGEMAALGDLQRMGFVERAKGPFPPGPPSITPSVITDAGRAALARAAPQRAGFICGNCSEAVELEWKHCAWCGSTPDWLPAPPVIAEPKPIVAGGIPDSGDV